MAISARVYKARQQALSAKLPREAVLFMGHYTLPRNYLANPLPFRQDSTFLFFSGCRLPGAAMLIWPDGTSTLYLPFPTTDDELWHGRQVPPEFIARKAGARAVFPIGTLPEALNELKRMKVTIHGIPVCEPQGNAALAKHLGLPLDPALPASGSLKLLEAVVELRLCRGEEEISEMRWAAEVTDMAHRVAMEATRPGVREDEIQALIEAVFQANGMTCAYPPIVTIEGEVLHGQAAGRELKAGQLLLVDAGAETPDGYACDVTRTWPVSGKFDPKQKLIYQAVLQSQKAAIKKCLPGVRFRDVHLAAARSLIQFCINFELMKGDVDELLEKGAHAIFFPHGVGHLIGLDVHDMELYGDIVGYDKGAKRDGQFGLNNLRLDRTLEEGMVVTVEPGFYIIPHLLRDQTLRDTLGEGIYWEEAHRFAPFGGIRIEDDILITDEGPEVLTSAIPKEAKSIETLVGSGLSPSERLSPR